MDGILGILISLGILPIIIKVISDRTGNWINGFFDLILRKLKDKINSPKTTLWDLYVIFVIPTIILCFTLYYIGVTKSRYDMMCEQNDKLQNAIEILYERYVDNEVFYSKIKEISNLLDIEHLLMFSMDEQKQMGEDELLNLIGDNHIDPITKVKLEKVRDKYNAQSKYIEDLRDRFRETLTKLKDCLEELEKDNKNENHE